MQSGIRIWLCTLCFVLTACGHATASKSRRTPEPAAEPAPDPAAEQVIVDLASGPVNQFSPEQAFGAVIDGLQRGRVAQSYTPANIAALKQAGLRPIAYNLRSELGIEAWHWSDEGTWSDAAHHQGYWTGSDHPQHPVMTGWGYSLPRRGDTTDQANENGYSRLDDGSTATFWKTNPYLDSAYTHQPARPQWAIVSFLAPTAINAARIQWAQPYARRYEVQYWTGIDQYDDAGRWKPFPHGRITQGTGGDQILRLADTPMRQTYIRFLLQASSHTALPGAHDPRDAMGYAIREIGLGTVGPGTGGTGGVFHDAMDHSTSGPDQTNIYTSSTDPWHRSSDRDPDAEHPGFDFLYRSGLTNGLPILLNVGALYDTPENTAAQIRFLTARGYPVGKVGIGLEPDGQNIAAEDYAELYMQDAAAIHAVAPHMKLAGPGLQDAVSDTWLDDTPDHSWTRRFIQALRARHRLGDLDEFTYEHYPFDTACGAIDEKLRTADKALADGIARLRADGVPANVPLSIVEYGMSAFSGQSAVEMPEGLFGADMVANFLTLGGQRTFLLGYGPEALFEPENDCAGYGELMLFGQDAKGQVAWHTPAFWATAMLTQQWAQPGNGTHTLYRAAWHPAKGSLPDAITAYPVRRPDGRVAVLLINRDPAHPHRVRLKVLAQAGKPAVDLPGPYEVTQYGPQQYVWKVDGANGHPTRDNPPAKTVLQGGTVVLPAYSITVLRASQR